MRMLRGALKCKLKFFSVFYSSLVLQYAMMHAVVKMATAFLGKNINWEWERSRLRVFTVKEAKQVLPLSLFGFHRNIKASKACQMALKWKASLMKV